MLARRLIGPDSRHTSPAPTRARTAIALITVPVAASPPPVTPYLRPDARPLSIYPASQIRVPWEPHHPSHPPPMSPDFKDPARVQALLDQIRSSSAWQQLSTSHTLPPPSATEPPPRAPELTNREPPSSSVASLLSQLQSPSGSSQTSVDPTPNRPQSSERTSLRSSVPLQEAPSVPEKDLRFIDLDEAMPILLRLSRQPSFIDEMKKIKQDQDALERQLWEERRNIHRKYEDKLKAAQTKANIIGVTISKHETDMIVDAHKKEIRKFDTDRALPAWDSLVSQQQLKLQKLHVPTMHITSESSARELQQRVLQLLISVIGPSIK